MKSYPKGLNRRMAKTKQTKRKKQPPRPRSSYRKLSTIACGMIQTGSRGASPANLKHLYGIDEPELADAPPETGKDEADLYRMLLYVPISMLEDRHVPDTAFQQISRSCRDAAVSSFETTCPALLSFLLMGDQWDGAVQPREIMDAIGPVERLMPDRFYNGDDASQSERHAHVQFSDGFSTALSDMVDWESITETGDLRDWSAKLLSMVDALVTEDRLETMNAKAVEVYAEAARWSQTKLKSWTDKADDTIRSMGLIPPRPQPAQSPIPVPARSTAVKAPDRPGLPLIGAMNRQNPVGPDKNVLIPPGRIGLPPELSNRSGARLPLDDMLYYDEVREAPAWMRPAVSLTHACSNKRSAELFRHLISHGFLPEEVFYAAYKIAGIQGNGLTCFASMVALCPLSTRFVHMPIINLFSQEESGDGDIVLDAQKRRTIPDSCMEIHDRITAEEPDLANADEMRSDGTSVWEAVSTASGVMPHARLRIRMAREKDFLDMGLESREAAALCGYIEGARASRTHAILGTLYMPNTPSRKPIQVQASPFQAQAAEPAQAPMPDEASIRAEYEGRIAAAQAKAAQAGNELDRAAAELRRSRKAASHEIADANSRISDLEAKNAELEAQLRKSRDEAARLSQSVLDLTLDLPEDDGTSEDDDGSGLPSWPSTVGDDCTIRFYGGHENFLAEMSRRFPNVEFSPAWKMPNTDGIAGADLILINTRSMKHKMWYSIQKAINKSGQSYILCPTRGANACSRLILDSYAAWKAELEGAPAGD